MFTESHIENPSIETFVLLALPLVKCLPQVRELFFSRLDCGSLPGVDQL
jgi:hypothetical protein